MAGSNLRSLVLLLVTSGFFATGLLFDYLPMIIDEHIKRNIELATNEEILSFWSKPPIDVHSYYWLYEIVNAEQFQTAGEKVQVRKVGPFHLISRFEKRIVELSENKLKLVYNSTRHTKLNESHSAHLLDQPLQLLNPILVSILEGTRVNGQEMDGQSRAVALGSMNKITERYNESLVQNVTARLALLGRPMPIVEKLKKIALAFGMADRLPELPADGKFGYASATNGTWQGPFEIYTGYKETARSLGDVISFKGKRRLDYYEGKCNRLQASAGELRPMPIDPSKLLEVFQPGFCRILHLKPTGQVQLREGQAINYVVAPDDFLSARTNPDNRCYCTNTTKYDDHCSLDGVAELAPCSYNAPLLLTLSNMQLDPKITATIRDFEPELLRAHVEQLPEADERAQFVILKRVGVPIKVDLTATIIMKVIRDPSFKQTVGVPEVSYVPLVTFRESLEIPPKLGQIIVNLESFLSLTHHIKVIMYLSAIVLLCWLTGHHYCQTPVGHSNSGRRGHVRSGGGGGGGGGGTTGGSNNNSQRRSSRATSASGGVALALGDRSSVGVSAFDGTKMANGQPPKESSCAQQRADHRPTSGGRANNSQAALTSVRLRRNTMLNSEEEQQQEQQQQQQNAETDAKVNRQTSSGQPTSGQRKAVNTQRASVARFFSQVDVELQARANHAGSKLAPAKEVDGSLVAVGGERLIDKTTIGGVTAGSSSNLNSNTDVGAIAGTDTDTDVQGEASVNEAAGERERGRSKGWLMKVYSRFVGLLSGIRSTMSEVNPLDVVESDYQDKQLEMLASKIDNWYSGSPSEPTLGEDAADESGRSTSQLNGTNQTTKTTSDAGDTDQTSASVGHDEESAAKRPESRNVGQLAADVNRKSVAMGPRVQVSETSRPEDESEPEARERERSARRRPVAAAAASNAVGQKGAQSDRSSNELSNQNAPVETTQANEKRSADDVRSEGRAASGATNKSETASLLDQTSGELDVDEGHENELGEEDAEAEADEDEIGEAERRQEDEAQKAITLRQIEAALGAADKSQSEREADLSGARLVPDELTGDNKRAPSAPKTTKTNGDQKQHKADKYEEPPRINMINSSPGPNEDEVSLSSLDSRVTQVANSEVGSKSDVAQLSGRPNQSVGDETARAAKAASTAQAAAAAAAAASTKSAENGGPAGEKIDESSRRQQQQSNRWPAKEAPPDDVIGRVEQLANGDLPYERATKLARAATSRPLDSSDVATGVGSASLSAASARDNGRANKLDGRNEISVQRADQAASSLTEPSEKTDASSLNSSKLDSGPVGGAHSQSRPAALRRGLNEAKNGNGTRQPATPSSPLHGAGRSRQVNGLVVAAGQPINVGAPPAPRELSTGGAHNGEPPPPPSPPSPPSGSLLAAGNLRHVSIGQGNNITPLTVQQRPCYAAQRGNGNGNGLGRVGGHGHGHGYGNNILNEKIISHQQRPRAAGAVGFYGNQHSANGTTGNHHHQRRLRPAGA